MKINKKQSTKKSLAITLAILLIIGLASLSAYVFAFNGSIFGWQPSPASQTDETTDTTDTTPDPEAPPSEEQIRDGEDIKRDSLDDDEEDQPQTTSLQITSYGQNTPGEAVSVRALIQRTTNQGTCTLTMTSGDNTVTRTAAVQALPNGSTCQGFDVPFSSLSAGTWDTTVEYRNGDDNASDTVSIEVRG